MSDNDQQPPIEGHATAVDDPPAAEMVVRAPAQQLAVAPQVSASELVDRLDSIKQAQAAAMQEGVDYGVIPGTDKPALMKPGAEKLGVLFQLDVQLRNEKVWGPGDHLTVLSHATVYHAPTGARLGYGEGICTSREKKYAVRRKDRACPECGEEAIKRSKYPPRDNPGAEKGWYCFAKIGGCGANFDAADERITGQEEGERENPDLPDTWNTIDKMASKRARVDAVLAVTGASALFTQDVEEQGQTAPEEAAALGAATDEERKAASSALTFLCGAEAPAKEAWVAIKQRHNNVLPSVIALALSDAATAVQELAGSGESASDG